MFQPAFGTKHFCANMWQSAAAVSKTTGMCSTGACSSDRGLVDPSYNPNSKISLSEARQICQLHYGQYLNRLSQRRSPQQRNARYNGTIKAVFDQCLFDVTSTGMASAALSGLEVLMVEEITTDAVTLDDIATSFKKNIGNEIAVLATTIREAEVQVERFLKQSI
ncbi:unnamed protein product [Adineta steineri]|uniref:Uncharacterized protein n=1 Tax=Adineta steineri TaxID=433720 RepID=A0A819S8L1_9BILA|nr:unnamed protein product [Adineta steineri]CAF4059274.1 unnamed protein product [Adineta steineri]